MLERVYTWATKRPEAPALAGARAEMTYGALWTAVCALAARLPRGGRALVWAQPEPAGVVALLACMQAGCAYTPVDPAQPENRLRQICADLQPDVVLAAGAFPLKGWPVVEVGQPAAVAAAWAPPHVPAADDEVYRMYTSGSSGVPKGVCISHGNLGAFLGWMQMLPTPQRVLNTAPLGFDLSVAAVHYGLFAGACVCLETSAPPSGVDMVVATPSWVAEQLRQDRLRLPAPARIFLCGETLPAPLAGEILARWPEVELLNAYGPTETTVAVSRVRITDEMLAWKSLPVGTEADREWVCTDAAGGLVVRGPLVGLGYADGGPGGFRADGYHTGDFGEYRDGYLFCHGRKDRQIKHAGHRVELGEIEAALEAVPGVKRAVALYTGLLYAYVQGAQTAGLRQRLARRLPRYMLPARILAVDSWPLTENGKVDTQALARAADARQADAARMIAEVCGWNGVPALDEAVEVDSLAVVDLEALFEDEFGVQLNPTEFAPEQWGTLGGILEMLYTLLEG